MYSIHDAKLFVASLPKAGTHLFAKILEEVGLYNTSWHVGYSRTMFSNVPDQKLLDFQLESDLHRGIVRFVDVDRNSVMKLLPRDHFCVGHLPPHVFDPIILDKMRVVFLYRKPRDMLMSTFDYFSINLPEEKTYASVLCEENIERRFEVYLQKILPHTTNLWFDMLLWCKNQAAFALSYEDMKSGADFEIIHDAISHLGVELNRDEVSAAVHRALKENTITKNAIPHNERPSIWTPRCEDLFLRFGGVDFEDRLKQLRG